MMNSVTLDYLLESTRQHSAEQKHFYVGVEHLMATLLSLRGGLTAELLDRYGLTATFGQQLQQETSRAVPETRHWSDIWLTPRAEQVLNAAQALIEQGEQPDDRALLLAILEEGDNLPIRLLQALDANVPAMRDEVRQWAISSRAVAPTVPIIIEDSAVTLNADQERVLHTMFRDAARVFIKRSLQDGHSGAVVLLVQPLKDGLIGAPVIVKIDDRYTILHEKRRFDQWVKNQLPPTSARIIDEPTLPSDARAGGLKYTFVTQAEDDVPTNLRDYALAHDTETVAEFIQKALYEPFRRYWWGQSQPGYRFPARQEYELLLPPALIIEAVPGSVDALDNQNAYALSVRSIGPEMEAIMTGALVVLEGFVVLKVRPERGALYLSTGIQDDAEHRASRVEVRGLPLTAAADSLVNSVAPDSFQPGQVLPRLVGRVIATRADVLQAQIQRLEADFDLGSDELPFGSGDDGRDLPATLPNPLHGYTRLLDRMIDGRSSPIHGDLHLGNILIGPAGDAWLIDFEWTRKGHTLFDWATLEMSILIDLLAPQLEATGRAPWSDCRVVVGWIDTLNRQGVVPEEASPATVSALSLIRQLRLIVAELLASERRWSEYFTALALCAIRVPSWPDRSVTARRLMFLLSALCIATISELDQAESGPDATRTTSDGRGQAI